MKRLLVVLLAFALCFSLAACSVQAVPIPNAEKPPRTVTDVWGRVVKLPETVEKIICLGSGAPRIAAYLNVMDLLVGAEEHDRKEESILRDYQPVHYEAMKKLPMVGSGGGSGSNNGYPEEIIKAAPDVILAGFSQESADELEAQTGIPVVSVRYTSHGLANDSFYDAMRVFAQVVGAEDRCEEVLSFLDSCKADLKGRTAEIEESAKQTAYTGAVTFSGRHGFAGTYAQFGPFDAIGAKNVADEVTEDGYFEADLEKVLDWDPDVIFLDPGNLHLVEAEISANPGYFGALRAIREGRVYGMPSFNNCGMNISYALLDAYYAGTVLFPAQFSDVVMAEKGREILTFFLGEDTYEKMSAGGLTFGVIDLGFTQ